MTKIESDIKRLSNFFSSNRIQDWNFSSKSDDLMINNDPLRLKANTIKLFIDGVFESGTALWHKEPNGKNFIYFNYI